MRAFPLSTPARRLRLRPGGAVLIVLCLVAGMLSLGASAASAAGPAAGSISGTVRLDSGTATTPGSALVYYYRWDEVAEEWQGGQDFVWTNEDGEYSWRGLPDGEYRIQAVPESDRYAPVFFGGAYELEGAVSVPVRGGEQVAGIDLTAPALGSLWATVRARANAGDAPAPLPATSALLWRLDPQSGVWTYSTQGSMTFADGVFRVDRLLPGTYSVRFFADPEAWVGAEYYADARYFTESADIVVGPGESTVLEDVVLEPRVFDVGRLAGADRYETAVAVSRTMYPNAGAAPVVYLTNGLNYPDALAAGPAAARVGGLILPTTPTGLPGAVRDELVRLKPSRVVVVGGVQAIGQPVVAAVRAALGAATPITRVGGATRYETAELIVGDAYRGAHPEVVFLATGRGFADALSAGAAAAANDAPVLLVDGAAGMAASTRTLLASLDPEAIVLVGRASAIGDALEWDARALGTGPVHRVGGADRFETSALLGQTFFDVTDHALLASGLGFADALVGGPLAASLGAPLLLSRPECIPPVSADVLVSSQAAGVVLIGGEAVLSRAVGALALC